MVAALRHFVILIVQYVQSPFNKYVQLSYTSTTTSVQQQSFEMNSYFIKILEMSRPTGSTFSFMTSTGSIRNWNYCLCPHTVEEEL